MCKVRISYLSKSLEKLETCTLTLRFITTIYHYHSSWIFAHLSTLMFWTVWFDETRNFQSFKHGELVWQRVLNILNTPHNKILFKTTIWKLKLKVKHSNSKITKYQTKRVTSQCTKLTTKTELNCSKRKVTWNKR